MEQLSKLLICLEAKNRPLPGIEFGTGDYRAGLERGFSLCIAAARDYEAQATSAAAGKEDKDLIRECAKIAMGALLSSNRLPVVNLNTMANDAIKAADALAIRLYEFEKRKADRRGEHMEA